MEIEKILTDPKSLVQVLLYLYYQQTQQEQTAAVTVETNGRGFNKVDADFLSSLARWVLTGKPLTEKQTLSAKLRLGKYHAQLEDGAWQNVEMLTLPPAIPGWRGSAGIDFAKPDGPVSYLNAGYLTLDPKNGGLMFKPNVYPSKQIKSIHFTGWSDGYWHQANGYISNQVIDDLKRMFGNIEIDPAVLEALKPPVVELPEFVAEHDTLFPFQKETVAFALARKRVLLGLAPGLGKTACGIFAARATNSVATLVISPLSLLYNWRKEVKKWVGEDAVIWYGKGLPVPGNWVITNYDTLRLHPKQFEQHWDCIIIDETILLKNRHTKRTQVVGELVRNTKPEYVFALSGAPVSKFYSDIWAQLHILNPKRFSSFWRFAERYVHIEANQWSKYNMVANKPGAGQQLVEDLQDIYIARSQDDVLDLPEFIFDDVHVPLTKEQDKLYASMEETFLAELSEDDTLMAPNVLTQLLRLVQFASNPVLVGGVEKSSKWDACIEMLEYEQGPFIIWTSFIDTATAMVERLKDKGWRAEKLTGATKIADRQTIVDKFQSGELDVIVAHPAVGKFGLTLTAARTAIYLERGYNGDDYYQSLHRVRRIGTKFSPHIIHLIADRANGEDSTVDEVINKILAGRKDMVKSITHMGLKNMFMEAIDGQKV